MFEIVDDDATVTGAVVAQTTQTKIDYEVVTGGVAVANTTQEKVFGGVGGVFGAGASQPASKLLGVQSDDQCRCGVVPCEITTQTKFDVQMTKFDLEERSKYHASVSTQLAGCGSPPLCEGSHGDGDALAHIGAAQTQDKRDHGFVRDAGAAFFFGARPMRTRMFKAPMPSMLTSTSSTGRPAGRRATRPGMIMLCAGRWAQRGCSSAVAAAFWLRRAPSRRLIFWKDSRMFRSGAMWFLARSRPRQNSTSRRLKFDHQELSEVFGGVDGVFGAGGLPAGVKISGSAVG